MKSERQYRSFRVIIVSFVFAVLCSVVVPLETYAATTDYVWTHSTAGQTGDSLQWRDVAVSADGSKIAAVVYGEYIYTSADGGVTWMQRTAAGSRNWQFIASSDDGMYLAASVDNGLLYTSSDAGRTWTARLEVGSASRYNIAMSADGSKIRVNDIGGFYHVSDDYGVNWTITTDFVPGIFDMNADGTKFVYPDFANTVYLSTDGGVTRPLVTVENDPIDSTTAVIDKTAISADGSTIVATSDAAYSGNAKVYISHDSGATWTSIPAVDNMSTWSSLDISADGAVIILGGSQGSTDNVFVSTDGGVSWHNHAITGVTESVYVAVSADGTKLIAADGYNSTNGGGSMYTSVDGGTSWQSQVVGNWWSSIASSDDGSRLVAVGRHFGNIYVSSDYGATWTSENVSENSLFTDVASSADGMKLVAVSADEGLLTSTDGGASWTWQIQMVPGWSSVTSSADGTKLAATIDGGSIYTSTDSGVTWTERISAGSRAWTQIASSADGTKLAATTNVGGIYTSADSGATWTERTSAGSRSWTSIASNSDGTKLVASVDGGSIYTSTDSGTTWTEQTGAGTYAWQSVASSADGVVLSAAAADYIYVSHDGGATWTVQSEAAEHSWSAITMNASGTRLAATADRGVIFLGSGTRPVVATPTTPTNPVTGSGNPTISTTNNSSALADTGVSIVAGMLGATGLIVLGGFAIVALRKYTA